MKLPTEFWEQLPLKTDAELYDILANEQDYLPEALAAVKDELTRRNVTSEKIAQLESQSQHQLAQLAAKAQEPLGWPMRIFLFIFCAGLIGPLFAVYYDRNGYKRKASDCWTVLGLSITFHVLVGIMRYLTR